MESLTHAYDLAQDDQRATGWIRYCGAQLGVSSEGDGIVYVWDVQSTEDTDEKFDTEELSVREFMTAVEEWVHNEVTQEL